MWVAMIECSMDYGVTTRYRSCTCMYNTYGKNSVETNDPVFTRCGVWRQLQVAAEKHLFSHSGACTESFVSSCNCANSDTQDRILRWESSRGAGGGVSYPGMYGGELHRSLCDDIWIDYLEWTSRPSTSPIPKISPVVRMSMYFSLRGLQLRRVY